MGGIYDTIYSPVSVKSRTAPARRQFLRKCQELAQQHLNRQKQQIERVKSLKSQLKELTGKERQKQEVVIEDLRRRIMKPIEKIFETQLKPRLDKLPTRAQREAAEQCSQTKPSSKPPKP